MHAAMLQADALRDALKQVPLWNLAEHSIARSFQSGSAREALALIQRIGDVAEDANHHPELTWVYNRIDLVLTTHDAGGITAKDIELARSIDEILRAS